jgi:hypothetical protein
MNSSALSLNHERSAGNPPQARLLGTFTSYPSDHPVDRYEQIGTSASSEILIMKIFIADSVAGPSDPDLHCLLF